MIIMIIMIMMIMIIMITICPPPYIPKPLCVSHRSLGASYLVCIYSMDM